MANSRSYHLPNAASTSVLGGKLIKAIYTPDKARFDRLLRRLNSLEQPLGIGRSKWTALMHAVHKQRVSMVRALLAKGADPNCIDHSNKKSCLHSACSLRSSRIVSMLLKSGRIHDINYAVADGSAPGEAAIHIAVKKCYSEHVRMLLDTSLHSQICDINARLRSNGQSPLFMACDKGDAVTVRMLIQYQSMKCNLDAPDFKLYTPLMKAVAKGHRAVVELLLDPNRNPLGPPDLTKVNFLKQCASMIAVRTANYGLARMLLEHPRNEGVLFRRDDRGRSVLDFLMLNVKCDMEQYQKRKMATELVKELLLKELIAMLRQMADSKECDSVPHLPNGIVRCISIMTY